MADSTTQADGSNGTPAAAAVTNPPGGAPGGSSEQGSEDVASLKAQLARVLKHNDEIARDNAKYREQRKDEERKATEAQTESEKKLREAGEFAKLHDVEKEKRTALEQQLASVLPKAQRYDAVEQRAKAEVDAAKAAGNLPSWLIKAIDTAVRVDVVEAREILEEFRRGQSTTTTAVVTASPAPAPGAAPPAQRVSKRVEDMTVPELDALRSSAPDEYARLVGGPPNGAKNGSMNPLKWLAERRG